MTFPSSTSRAAAAAIEPRKKSLRKQVEEFILSRREIGATDDEAQIVLKMLAHTEVPRRIELFRDRLIVNSGRMRATRSGQAAVVWVHRQFATAEPDRMPAKISPRARAKEFRTLLERFLHFQRQHVQPCHCIFCHLAGEVRVSLDAQDD